MPRVFVPRHLHGLAGSEPVVDVSATTVREVVDQLEQRFPGIRERLCDGDRLRAGLNVTADGQICALGLRHRLTADAEVHFIPAIGGG